MSQKVLVAGTGISGIAAAKLLLSKGGEVVLYDGNEKLDPEELKKKFDEGATITFVLGELKKTDLLGVELAILSPGIPTDAPFVEMIRETGIPICISLCKRTYGSHYRHERKDNDDFPDRRDHEVIL